MYIRLSIWWAGSSSSNVKSLSETSEPSVCTSSAISGTDPGRIIMKFANLINQNTEELAALDTIDARKLFRFAKAFDIPSTAYSLRYNAGPADKIHREVLKMWSCELQGYTLREPIGFVGHITLCNIPSSILFMKVSPALTAGCTVVIKPAEH